MTVRRLLLPKNIVNSKFELLKSKCIKSVADGDSTQLRMVALSLLIIMVSCIIPSTVTHPNRLVKCVRYVISPSRLYTMPSPHCTALMPVVGREGEVVQKTVVEEPQPLLATTDCLSSQCQLCVGPCDQCDRCARCRRVCRTRKRWTNCRNPALTEKNKIFLRIV